MQFFLSQVFIKYVFGQFWLSFLAGSLIASSFSEVLMYRYRERLERFSIHLFALDFITPIQNASTNRSDSCPRRTLTS